MRDDLAMGELPGVLSQLGQPTKDDFVKWLG